MSQIALVSDNDIISKIFLLVTKKLSLNMDIYPNDDISTKYEYIIVDDEVAVDIKQIDLKTSNLILLSSELTTNTFYDHVIKKPFLPSDLFKILEEIINKEEIVQKKETTIVEEPKIQEEYPQDTESLYKLVDNVVETLDIEESIEDVSIDRSSLGFGGVLDNEELTKLGNILNDATPNISNNNKDDEEWIELSQIVDRAIDELEIMANNEIKPINLQINKQNLNEIKPLLKKLNQEIIDALVEGSEITLKLRLEK